MLVVLVVLVTLALAAPRGAPDLGAEVAELATVQEHLPLASVGEIASRLEVVLHDLRAGTAMAYYAPALPRPDAVATPGSPAGHAASGGGSTGSSPALGETAPTAALAPPRLVLYGPYYRRADGSWLPPVEMTPDVVEYWSHALLLAYLHLEVLDGAGEEGEYGVFLRQRAAEHYPELEPDAALGLMVTALASFGSHILSLANEIERLRLRRPDADLCGLMRSRKLHFASWARAFGDEEYVGVAAERGGESYPRRSIGIDDKKAFVRNVLEGRWSGDPQIDFGPRLCVATRAEP